MNLRSIRDLYAAQHERRLSLAKAEREEKRLDEIVRTVTSTLPAVVDFFLLRSSPGGA